MGSHHHPKRQQPRLAQSESCAMTRLQCFRSADIIWVIISITGLILVRNQTQSKLPKIFYVNWFRKDENGKFMWPGYGDNIRALKWALERVAGTGKFEDSPLGRVPELDTFDISGIDVSKEL